MSEAYAAAADDDDDEHEEEGHGHGHGDGCDRFAASGRAPPSLDLLYWCDEAPASNGVHCPPRRSSATNDSSAFMNASDERPHPPMPPRSVVVRTNQVRFFFFANNLPLTTLPKD